MQTKKNELIRLLVNVFEGLNKEKINVSVNKGDKEEIVSIYMIPARNKNELKISVNLLVAFLFAQFMYFLFFIYPNSKFYTEQNVFSMIVLFLVFSVLFHYGIIELFGKIRSKTIHHLFENLLKDRSKEELENARKVYFNVHITNMKRSQYLNSQPKITMLINNEEYQLKSKDTFNYLLVINHTNQDKTLNYFHYESINILMKN